MRLNQLAAQLYTVRDFCKTAADLAVTAQNLRTIGYTAVQVSGIGPIPDDEVRRIMDGNGLTICATHEPSLQLLDQPELSVERLRRLGCKYTAYPWPRDIDFGNAAHVEKLARQLDHAGAVLRAAGLTMGYHNHAIEFVPFRGRPVLEHLFAVTKRENVVAELDTYWIHFGGGDVVAWLQKLSGRVPTMHLKDYGFTLQNQPRFAEIGAGNLDWKRIIPAAEAAGTQWFIVEQDICPGDPFASLQQSFEYVKNNLVG